MHEHYEYRRIRIAPRSWRAVVEHVRGAGRAAVESRGGSLFGFWRGQIGLAADEGVIISAWPGARELTEHGPAVVEGIPGTRGQPHTTIEDAGHFLQEDQGEEFARVIVEFMSSS
jgi:hypothetical protein